MMAFITHYYLLYVLSFSFTGWSIPWGWEDVLFIFTSYWFISWHTADTQCCCSVAQSCPTLQPHGLQHTLLPSPSPWACSHSCPLSQWCHPTILSSVISFSSHLQSFPASGIFQWVSSSHQVVEVLELQLQPQSFQWMFSTYFLHDWLVGSPCSPRDSPESSPTPQLKTINSLAFSLLYGPTVISVYDYWKNHRFDYLGLCRQSNVSAV